LGIALDEPTEEDEQISSNGIDIIFNKQDKNFFHHTTIDFESSFFGKGFVVRSANAGAC
jgi:Fe-S cluster assembly iron-binding protein IscA